jgi:formylmethanofuran dehydrogenase subunit E
MNEIEQLLYKTRNTVLDARLELDLEVESVDISNIAACSSCGIWLRPKELKPDQDGMPICKDCLRWYGF